MKFDIGDKLIAIEDVYVDEKDKGDKKLLVIPKDTVFIVSDVDKRGFPQITLKDNPDEYINGLMVWITDDFHKYFQNVNKEFEEKLKKELEID